MGNTEQVGWLGKQRGVRSTEGNTWLGSMEQEVGLHVLAIGELPLGGHRATTAAKW